MKDEHERIATAGLYNGGYAFPAPPLIHLFANRLALQVQRLQLLRCKDAMSAGTVDARDGGFCDRNSGWTPHSRKIG